MENITFSSVVFFMSFLLIPSSDELPHNYPCVVQWSADRQVCLPDKPATNGLSSREPLPICISLRNAAGYIPDIFQHVRKAFHVFQHQPANVSGLPSRAEVRSSFPSLFHAIKALSATAGSCRLQQDELCQSPAASHCSV